MTVDLAEFRKYYNENLQVCSAATVNHLFLGDTVSSVYSLQKSLAGDKKRKTGNSFAERLLDHYRDIQLPDTEDSPKYDYKNERGVYGMSGFFFFYFSVTFPDFV